MKTFLLNVFVGLFVLLGLSSCKKQLIEKYEENKTTPTVNSTKEIKAPSTFNWNTANTVSFNFKGRQGDVRKSTLKIINSVDNSVVFKKLQLASESYTDVIELPAYVNKITVIYDGTSTNYTLNSNSFEIGLK